MKYILFIVLCVLVGASQAINSCSATASVSSRSGQDWVDGDKKYTGYDLVIINTGSCDIDLIQLHFSLPSGAQIAWSINSLGNGNWELKNFGQLKVGSTFSAAGIVLQYLHQHSLSVYVVNSNCLCNPLTNPPSPDPSPITVTNDLITKLITAPSQLDRQKMLSDEQLIFDFTNPLPESVIEYEAGKFVSTTRKNFPGIIGHNMAMSVGSIQPCGIILPHSHPRAAEIVFVSSGRIHVGVFSEDGTRIIDNIVDTGMATIFGQGSNHFELNLDCIPSSFVSAFNHEDAGLQMTSNMILGLSAEVVGLSLNTSNIQTLNPLFRHLPVSFVVAIQSCFQRCALIK